MEIRGKRRKRRKKRKRRTSVFCGGDEGGGQGNGWAALVVEASFRSFFRHVSLPCPAEPGICKKSGIDSQRPFPIDKIEGGGRDSDQPTPDPDVCPLGETD